MSTPPDPKHYDPTQAYWGRQLVEDVRRYRKPRPLPTLIPPTSFPRSSWVLIPYPPHEMDRPYRMLQYATYCGTQAWLSAVDEERLGDELDPAHGTDTYRLAVTDLAIQLFDKALATAGYDILTVRGSEWPPLSAGAIKLADAAARKSATQDHGVDVDRLPDFAEVEAFAQRVMNTNHYLDFGVVPLDWPCATVEDMGAYAPTTATTDDAHDEPQVPELSHSKSQSPLDRSPHLSTPAASFPATLAVPPFVKNDDD